MAKKKVQSAGAPAWMATFADMVTLLMAFFVLLLAFSEMDIVKYKAISGSLRGDFGITIAGGQDHLKGKIFRMAAMGWADDKDVIQALGALEIALEKAGHKVPQRGAGVAAALDLFSRA